METLTADYLIRAELWLLISILFYFLMNGAGIFETVVLVPKWSEAPPNSFQLFKGKHAIDLKTFWIIMHSVHEITFILAIVFCWQMELIRNGLLILFAIHFVIRIWTLIYFAPNIMAFQKIAETNVEGVSNDLLQRTTRWRRLNYIRTGLFVIVSIALVLLYFQIHSIALLK